MTDEILSPRRDDEPSDALIELMRLWVQQWDTTTEIARRVRAEVIEECVQRVISWSMTRGYSTDVAAELAAALRALKDKP